MKRKILLLSLLIFTSLWYNLMGQQMIIYQHNISDLYPVNPAIAGIDEKIHINICYSKQYTGITQNPGSSYLDVYSRLGKRPPKVYRQYSLRISQPSYYNKLGNPKPSKLFHGVGIMISNDVYGQFKKLNSGISYSLHYRLNTKINAAIGISSGIVNFSFNKDGLIPGMPGDETLDQFITQNYSTSFLNFNAGMLLYSSKWRFSYSAHQLLGNQIWFRSVRNQYKILLHHFLYASYMLKMKDGNIKVVPGAMLRYVSGLDPLIELNSLINYGNFQGGIAYRFKNSVFVLLGYNFNKYGISYSYNLNTNALYKNTSGSHEVLISLVF